MVRCLLGLKAGGEKALVFAEWREVLRIVADALRENDISFLCLDGSGSRHKDVVAQFRRDPTCQVRRHFETATRIHSP